MAAFLLFLRSAWSKWGRGWPSTGKPFSALNLGEPRMTVPHQEYGKSMKQKCRKYCTNVKFTFVIVPLYWLYFTSPSFDSLHKQGMMLLNQGELNQDCGICAVRLLTLCSWAFAAAAVNPRKKVPLVSLGAPLLLKIAFKEGCNLDWNYAMGESKSSLKMLLSWSEPPSSPIAAI